MEQRLNVLRAAVWAREEAQEGGATHTLACALGLAGFAAEYVAVPPPGAEDATGLAAAMFRPLSPAEAAAVRGDVPLAALLVRRTVEEPALERSLGPTLERLTPLSEDTVSAEVRAQYEANPYPRWTLPPAPAPRPLRAGIEAQPGLDRRAFGDAATARIEQHHLLLIHHGEAFFFALRHQLFPRQLAIAIHIDRRRWVNDQRLIPRRCYFRRFLDPLADDRLIPACRRGDRDDLGRNRFRRRGRSLGVRRCGVAACHQGYESHKAYPRAHLVLL
jgi:hypothetical protein